LKTRIPPFRRDSSFIADILDGADYTGSFIADFLDGADDTDLLSQIFKDVWMTQMKRIFRINIIVLVVLYVAAGINHFWHPEFYTAIMPQYLPWPSLLVVISGVAEIGLGVLLIPASTRRWAAYGIALMLVAFLPVHIYMIQPSYRVLHPNITPLLAWGRLLLQPVLILWVLTLARRPKDRAAFRN
jgi:uncharacterized membrane protein